MQVAKPSKQILNKVVFALEKRRVVICSTDTVYGFLADASNKKAVEKIYKIKKRPRSKPLAVFVKDLKMAKELAEIDEEQEKMLKKYWPGEYTFILKRKKEIRLFDRAKNTIALRIPKYKFLNDLLKKINKPLAQTSVNISGQEPLIKSEKIIKQFQKTEDLLFIDAGNLPKKKPSAIMDLTKDNIKILRK